MHSKSLLATVLLASAVTIQDIDCLPTPVGGGQATSRLATQGPQVVNQAAKKVVTGTGSNSRGMTTTTTDLERFKAAKNANGVTVKPQGEHHKDMTQHLESMKTVRPGKTTISTSVLDRHNMKPSSNIEPGLGGMKNTVKTNVNDRHETSSLGESFVKNSAYQRQTQAPPKQQLEGIKGEKPTSKTGMENSGKPNVNDRHEHVPKFT